MAEIKLKRKRNIVKGAKGFKHPSYRYRHGEGLANPKLEDDVYWTGDKPRTKGGIFTRRDKKRKITDPSKVLYKGLSERATKVKGARVPKKRTPKKTKVTKYQY